MPSFEENRVFGSVVKKDSHGTVGTTIPKYLAELLGLRHLDNMTLKYMKDPPKQIIIEKTG